jgi:hypothetical protein
MFGCKSCRFCRCKLIKISRFRVGVPHRGLGLGAFSTGNKIFLRKVILCRSFGTLCPFFFFFRKDLAAKRSVCCFPWVRWKIRQTSVCEFAGIEFHQTYMGLGGFEPPTSHTPSANHTKLDYNPVLILVI